MQHSNWLLFSSFAPLHQCLKKLNKLNLNELEVGRELGSLRHLGRDGVDKVSHMTGSGIVSLHYQRFIKGLNSQPQGSGIVSQHQQRFIKGTVSQDFCVLVFSSNSSSWSH